MVKRRAGGGVLKKLSRLSFSSLLITFLSWTLYVLAAHVHSQTSSVVLPSAKQPLELYANQLDDNLTNLYLQTIEKAQHSIIVAIYSLTDQKIIQALHKKSLNNVSVFIIGDAKACKGVWKYLPNALFIKRIGKGLMHAKIIIVDDTYLLIGSANFTPSSFNEHGNLVVALQHPILAAKLTKYIRGMDEEGGLAVEPPHTITQAADQHVELWMLPNTTAVQRCLKLFRTAKKSIKVAMFTWTRTDFANELIQAAKRGVKVQTVIDRYAGKGAGAKVVALLESAKIPVRMNTGCELLHHKFALIDDTILINGSANWTDSAFSRNDDGFLIIYPLNSGQKDKMNRLWDLLLVKSAPPNDPIIKSNTLKPWCHAQD